MIVDRSLGALQALCGAYFIWMGYNNPSTQQKTEDFIVAAILFAGTGLILWRLLKPSLGKKPEAKNNLETFRNPQWETVIRCEFRNETVELDGKRFWDCTFINVKLVFNGTAPVEFMHGCDFSPNIILSTGCPAAMEYAKLIEIFGSLPNTQAKHVGVDKDGKPLPKTFHIQELKASNPPNNSESK